MCMIVYSTLGCIGYGEAPSMSTVPRLHQLDLMKSNGKSVSVIRSAASKWKQLATRLQQLLACTVVFQNW